MSESAVPPHWVVYSLTNTSTDVCISLAGQSLNGRVANVLNSKIIVS